MVTYNSPTLEEKKLKRQAKNPFDTKSQAHQSKTNTNHIIRKLFQSKERYIQIKLATNNK
jgi:hypothetical protein